MCQDRRPPFCVPPLLVQPEHWQGPRYGSAGRFAPARAVGRGVVGLPYEGFSMGWSRGGFSGGD